MFPEPQVLESSVDISIGTGLRTSVLWLLWFSVVVTAAKRIPLMWDEDYTYLRRGGEGCGEGQMFRLLWGIMLIWSSRGCRLSSSGIHDFTGISKLISSFYIRITGVECLNSINKSLSLIFKKKNAPINNVQLHCEKNHSQKLTWGFPVLRSGSVVKKTAASAAFSTARKHTDIAQIKKLPLPGLPKPHGLPLFIFLGPLRA